MIDQIGPRDEGADSPDALDLGKYREQIRLDIGVVADDTRWTKWRPLIDVPIMLLFIVAMTMLFAPPGSRHYDLPMNDSIAVQSIRADRDILVEDRRATELRQVLAGSRVLDVFDFDPERYFVLGDQVRYAVQELKLAKVTENKGDIAEQRAKFAADLGAPVSAGVFSIIRKMKEPEDIAAALNYFLNLALDRIVVAKKSHLPKGDELLIRDLSLETESRLIGTTRILDLRSLRRMMTARAVDAPYGEARIVRSWILDTAHTLAGANLTPNQEETERRRTSAVSDIAPVFVRIHAGEVILRRGDRVTEPIRERIKLLNQGLSDRVQWAETAAVAILLAGLVILGFGFFRRGRVPLQFSRKSSFLSLTIFGGVAAVSVATYYAGLGLAEGFGFDPQIAAYFAPLALATVLIALLIDARTSLLVGIGLTLFVAYRVDGGLWLVTYYLVGVLIAGIAARSSRRRLDLLKTGMYVGLAQAVLVPIIIVLSGQSFASLLLPMVAAAMASGALVSLATLGALPLFEHWFDEATELRLLEMAAGDSPILKELALTSPGTYHHSIMVANLAEAGANAVGANGLRCRVMALYHDIGKIRRPSYFSENQRAGENLHDRISPESSAKIIFDHVRDGLQMAKKEKLGNAVIEGIVEHHGTSLLRAFYQRALQGPHGNGTREEYFRYPGRKPKSREAGILMLADSTEAATRALTNPDPQELRQRVNQVLDRQVSDGQLDNCEMTLKDLAQMEEAFVRVLTLGVYHNRIEYPPTPGSGERLADDLDRKSDYGDRGVRFLRRMVERSN